MLARKQRINNIQGTAWSIKVKLSEYFEGDIELNQNTLYIFGLSKECINNISETP